MAVELMGEDSDKMKAYKKRYHNPDWDKGYKITFCKHTIDYGNEREICTRCGYDFSNTKKLDNKKIEN